MGFRFKLRRIVRGILPQSARDRVKAIPRRYRFARNKLNAQLSADTVTGRQIYECLEELDIRRDDVVIVHSSLSRLGMVDGGPGTVIGAIRQLVGAQGTVMVPTLHLGTSAVKHFESDPVFDVRRSPSRMGAISEYLRTLPDARRSLHPTHSAAAIGSLAQYLTEAHHKGQVPFGPCSPYFRLAESGGKSIMLGVSLLSLMSCRVIEDIMGDDFPYPVYMPDPVQARVVDWDGREFRVTTRIHNPEMSKLRRNEELEGFFLAYGIMKIGQVGRARTLAVDAAGVNRVLQELMEQDTTVYSPDGKQIESMLKPR